MTSLGVKKNMYYVVTAVIAIFLLVLYAKWFERSSIFFPTRHIEKTPLAESLAYEDVYFETEDGIRLNGWFIPAKQPARATILFCHGNAGNISHRFEIIEIFHSLDLNVFIFDYRGYGKSRGWPSEKGTYLDAQAAYDCLLARTDIDKERIIAYGKSLGGAVALDLATKRNACAVISDGVFTSTLDIAEEVYPFLPVKFFITMKYDTLSKIGSVRVPKLIIHSREDEIVPFHHGQKLFEKASGVKEFYPMRGGHNEAIIIYSDEYKKRIDEFLKTLGI